MLAAILPLALAWTAALPSSATDCGECHEDVLSAVASGPHRGVLVESTAFCAACHGDPAAHLESADAADIVTGATARQLDAGGQAAACLTCHRRDFPAWDRVPHAGEVSCWTCHPREALHFAEPERPAPRGAAHDRGQLDRCWSCHADVEQDFRLQYRHPLREGTVRCTDCHDIHGAEAEAALVDADSRRCASCHAEQAGPFLFEHEAMADGCATCHRPHGSWNRDLLRSAGNAICVECHVQSNFPGVGKVNAHEFFLGGGGRCWDCHSQVHGSNTNPEFNPRGRR
ncbi:MAG: hypothetical protein D6738_11580 [Acidobacteria bacterium]|nr:MAG: hypothetical protein D6738_11580 [Acidobacteriota bacterium]